MGLTRVHQRISNSDCLATMLRAIISYIHVPVHYIYVAKRIRLHRNAMCGYKMIMGTFLLRGKMMLHSFASVPVSDHILLIVHFLSLVQMTYIRKCQLCSCLCCMQYRKLHQIIVVWFCNTSQEVNFYLSCYMRCTWPDKLKIGNNDVKISSVHCFLHDVHWNGVA